MSWEFRSTIDPLSEEAQAWLDQIHVLIDAEVRQRLDEFRIYGVVGLEDQGPTMTRSMRCECPYHTEDWQGLADVMMPPAKGS